MIDVGGPSMLRAAAKNFAHVAAVCEPRPVRGRAARASRARRGVARDAPPARRARRSRRPPPTRRRSRRGSRGGERFPDQLTLAFRKVSRPPLRREPAPGGGALRRGRRAASTCSRASSSSAARSSRTTTSPTSKARAASRASSREPAAVIVKHANPCGVAVATTIEEAWERALAADPVSAFGCVAMLNRDGHRQRSARASPSTSSRCCFAPGYDDDALEALRTKQALRILCDRERRKDTPGERDYKRVLGGLLVQERDVDGAGARRDGGRLRRRLRATPGATSCSRGASASTSRRTRSCSPAACRRSASARAR